MEKFTLSRDAYKKLKSLNRIELENYLSELYITAHNNGVNSVTSVITNKIIEALENTKGIGEKRATEVLENLNKLLDKE